MLVAWRINRLMRLGRCLPELPADLLFETEEWQAAFLLNKKKLLKTVPPLNTVARLIAQLGGFFARKGDGEPGAKTLWLGLRDIAVFVQGLRFARILYEMCVMGCLHLTLWFRRRGPPSVGQDGERCNAHGRLFTCFRMVRIDQPCPIARLDRHIAATSKFLFNSAFLVEFSNSVLNYNLTTAFFAISQARSVHEPPQYWQSRTQATVTVPTQSFGCVTPFLPQSGQY